MKRTFPFIKSLLLVFLISAFLIVPLYGIVAQDDFEELIDEDLLEELDMSEEELEGLLKELEDINEEEGPYYEEDIEIETETEKKRTIRDTYIDEELGIVEDEKTRKVKKITKLSIPMVYVNGGCFMMGDNFETGKFDEHPVHKVCVDSFYIGVTEVTQELWENVMGFNPAYNKGKNLPIENVGWMDANDFLEKLNKMTGKFYRLPTEAEWEYAARGGARIEQWPGTNEENDVERYSWSLDNSGHKTHPVKSKLPNALGLYDMAGNVWEWVYDFYDMDYYKKRVESNPEGVDFSLWRGTRGGSFSDEIDKHRTSARNGMVPTRRTSHVGFRLAQ